MSKEERRNYFSQVVLKALSLPGTLNFSSHLTISYSHLTLTMYPTLTLQLLQGQMAARNKKSLVNNRRKSISLTGQSTLHGSFTILFNASSTCPISISLPLVSMMVRFIYGICARTRRHKAMVALVMTLRFLVRSMLKMQLKRKQ